MDYKKIGTFISDERKKLNLTQSKLAQKLFVSEKTISKWENGKSLPDTTILPKLCEIFNISINELLNGERIIMEEYKIKAEEKLLELEKQNEENLKKILFSEIIISFIAIIFFLTTLPLGVFLIENYSMIFIGVLLIVVSSVSLLITMFFCLKIEQKVGFYHCKHCDNKYVPTYSQVFFAMHINRTRFMKCPNCKKYSWHKKVLK